MRRYRLTEKHGTTDEQILQEFRSHDIDAQNISYDYFKSLTSLSIVTLGGILTLSEKVFNEQINSAQMLMAATLLGASGFIALQCQSDIVQVSRGKKKPNFWLRWGHRIAPGLFGGGVGSFLAFILTGPSV